MKSKIITVCLLATSTLAACETVSGAMPSTVSFGATPPTMVLGDRGLHWINIESFGPVPASEQARGDAACAAVPVVGGGSATAIGYHPEAVDYQGNTFEGGGFFCG